MCEHIEMAFSLVLKSTNDFQGNEMWHSMVWGNFNERNLHTNGVMLSALLERHLDIYLHCIAIRSILSKNKSIAQVLGSCGLSYISSFKELWLCIDCYFPSPHTSCPPIASIIILRFLAGTTVMEQTINCSQPLFGIDCPIRPPNPRDCKHAQYSD